MGHGFVGKCHLPRALHSVVIVLRSTIGFVIFVGLLPGFGATACSTKPTQSCGPGERGCPCTALGSCRSNLVCIDHACLEPHESFIRIHDARARSCEVLIRADAGRLVEVSFENQVRGAFAPRGPSMAVSFIAAADRPFSEQDVRVRYVPVGSGPSNLDVSNARCFGGRGEELDGVAASITP